MTRPRRSSHDRIGRGNSDTRAERQTLSNGPDRTSVRKLRCAVYTRKSTEEGLEMEFNSLDAQRESAEAYILSQRHAGWTLLPDRYDDGGYTGANLERPAEFNAALDEAAHRLMGASYESLKERLWIVGSNPSRRNERILPSPESSGPGSSDRRTRTDRGCERERLIAMTNL